MILHIAQMLRAQKKHVSFHTPGHKRAGTDITELSYSDNLLSPRGVIKQAEEDIAKILGADRSFILTDGSTAGVLAMLYALKSSGCKSVAVSSVSHPSIEHGCRLAGLMLFPVSAETAAGIPVQPSVEAYAAVLERADALLLTSPDYYGYFPYLDALRQLCTEMNKPLVIDGAHGAHLHFSEWYAGRFADMWVDGVHKSLPALTQGAVVSCKASWGDYLEEALALFRTTSPSYPIMASVEYAVKFPRNVQLEQMAEKYKHKIGAVQNGDWSKLLVPFGKWSDEAQRFLEQKGVYPEFNDGNYIMFYLSPCTQKRHLKKLARLCKKIPRGEIDADPDERQDLPEEKDTEWVELSLTAGRVCARDCGPFPPCLPLVKKGETVSESASRRLCKAISTFGCKDGKMLVYKIKPQIIYVEYPEPETEA